MEILIEARSIHLHETLNRNRFSCVLQPLFNYYFLFPMQAINIFFSVITVVWVHVCRRQAYIIWQSICKIDSQPHSNSSNNFELDPSVDINALPIFVEINSILQRIRIIGIHGEINIVFIKTNYNAGSTNFSV